MSSLLECYSAIYTRINNICTEIHNVENSIAELETDGNKSVTLARITHLEEQLKKIDEYELRIKSYLQLAEKCINSKNLLTVEAPENYRVNLNRLHRYAAMIDPRASHDPTFQNDPYAQKLFLVASCDLKFLSKKKEEFANRVIQLKNDEAVHNNIQLKNLKEKRQQLEEALKGILKESEVIEFADLVVQENQKNIFDFQKESFTPKEEAPEYFVPGAYGLPLPFDLAGRKWLKNVLGKFYDEKSGRVYLPVEKAKTNQEFFMTISCIPARKKMNELDAGIRNFLMNIADQSPVGSRKLYVIDAERQNTTILGTIRQLQNSFIMESIPRTQNQISETLEKIVASFSDMDEYLEDYDSVLEYNFDKPIEKRIQRSVIVLFGWPNSFSGNDKMLIKRIMANYERYGISLIIASIREDEVDKKSFGLSAYITENTIHIAMAQNDTTISLENQNTYKYAWYQMKGELTEKYVTSFKQHKVERESLGNEYIKRYDMVNLPPLTREYKKIILPYGIDSREQVQEVSFENENFAAYLVGASRSGKSTLLHTLIAGLLRNYHPDNLELWLADFKQLEFEKYIKYLPPHVKYILLDESQELVFDLINKLTEKMMERQQLFARLGKERIDQIDLTQLDEPLPVIFVILDEFSIMSQAISESPDYKLRLQNLLAKGAALGIKFLFSSQTFTTGIAGLTSTARAQIQQRISMKGSKQEISETLELSASLKTEQVRNWMEALPPHYALIKCRNGADSLPEVKRSLVMYFKDYAPRNTMIQILNQKLHAVDHYDPLDINSYLNKHPVLVDGKAYNIFDSNELAKKINTLKSSADFSEDEIYLSLGTPRLMSNMRLIPLSQESRENILLIARFSEQACAASIISSTMKSFYGEKRNIQIWAYSKNRMYRAYKNVWNSEEYIGIQILEDNDAVCDAIYELKEKIQNRESSNELIIMLGMERICSDFEFSDSRKINSFSNRKAQEKDPIKDEVIVKTKEQEEKRKLALQWNKMRRSIKAEEKSKGKTKEEIEEIIGKAKKEFFTQSKVNENQVKKTESELKAEKSSIDAEAIYKKEEKEEEDKQSGAYNAKEDFQYILKHGSRLGYHFMMVLNNYADLKLTFAQLNLFRHRLGFQVSKEESRELFAFRNASELPEHICQYYDTLERFSFRPYLHKGISWEGWYVDEDGRLINPFSRD